MSVAVLAKQSELQNLIQKTGWYWLGLLLGLAFLIWLIIRIRSSFRKEEDRAASADGMLCHFREMHRRGELTDAEYRSIKGRLVGQLSERMPHSRDRTE